MSHDPLPRKRKTPPKGKITVYPLAEIEELYFIGQENGWDTAEMAREAVTQVLMQRREELMRKAD